MFIVIFILFIILKLLNLYICVELSINTDKYIQVYNHIKGINKSSFLLLLTSNNSYLTKSTFKKRPVKSTELYNNKDLLLNILTNNLFLHYIKIYFFILLNFIYIMKLTVKNNIKYFPNGKYYRIFIMKLFKILKINNNFRLYFILIFLLIFLCGSSFGVLTCIFYLTG